MTVSKHALCPHWHLLLTPDSARQAREPHMPPPQMRAPFRVIHGHRGTCSSGDSFAAVPCSIRSPVGAQQASGPFGCSGSEPRKAQVTGTREMNEKQPPHWALIRVKTALESQPIGRQSKLDVAKIARLTGLSKGLVRHCMAVAADAQSESANTAPAAHRERR